MDKKLIIGYKFCGNCNPYKDTRQLLADLKKELNEEAEFVFWRDSGFDVLLILSGCLTDCAERPVFAGPVLSVAAGTLNRVPLGDERLQQEIVRQMRSIRQSGENKD